MKLLKKLLPFATIASVATVSMTTMAACNNGGEEEKVEEYSPKVIEHNHIGIETHKFQLHKPLVIQYDMDENYELDMENSSITIGKIPYTIDNFAIDENSCVITILGDMVTSKSITIDIQVFEHQPISKVWHPSQGGTPDFGLQRKSKGYTSTAAIYDYLTEASVSEQAQLILANDIGYTYYEEKDWSCDTLTVTINKIDADLNRISFTIVCESESQNSYYKIQFVDMEYSLTYCYVGYREVGWTLDPLFYWISHDQSKDAAVTYMQHDELWSISIWNSNKEVPDQKVNYQTEATTLKNDFIPHIQSYDFSFWTYYWENVEP